jgi:hypothetical protein
MEAKAKHLNVPSFQVAKTLLPLSSIILLGVMNAKGVSQPFSLSLTQCIVSAPIM